MSREQERSKCSTTAVSMWSPKLREFPAVANSLSANLSQPLKTLSTFNSFLLQSLLPKIDVVITRSPPCRSRGRLLRSQVAYEQFQQLRRGCQIRQVRICLRNCRHFHVNRGSLCLHFTLLHSILQRLMIPTLLSPRRRLHLHVWLDYDMFFPFSFDRPLSSIAMIYRIVLFSLPLQYVIRPLLLTQSVFGIY